MEEDASLWIFDLRVRLIDDLKIVVVAVVVIVPKVVPVEVVVLDALDEQEEVDSDEASSF